MSKLLFSKIVFDANTKRSGYETGRNELQKVILWAEVVLGAVLILRKEKISIAILKFEWGFSFQTLSIIFSLKL